MAYSKNQNPSITEWVQPFNPFLAFTALSMLRDSSSLFQACRLARTCELDRYYTRSVQDSWDVMQKDHHLMYAGVMESLGVDRHDELHDVAEMRDIYCAVKFGMRPGDESRQQLVSEWGKFSEALECVLRHNPAVCRDGAIDQ